MNRFIFVIEFTLLIWSCYNLCFDFFIPMFYFLFEKYNWHPLKDKNIKNNINHCNKTVYFHFLPFIHSALVFIVMIYNLFPSFFK
nr:hypothetical protein [Candidatus Phytoplasma sacchari]